MTTIKQLETLKRQYKAANRLYKLQQNVMMSDAFADEADNIRKDNSTAPKWTATMSKADEMIREATEQMSEVLLDIVAEYDRVLLDSSRSMRALNSVVIKRGELTNYPCLHSIVRATLSQGALDIDTVQGFFLFARLYCKCYGTQKHDC